MKELTVPARLENVDLVTDFVDELIEQTECPRKIIIKLNIAIDELFSNIARYAYGEGEGDATIGVEIDETARVIALTFTDSGIPYNPLKTATPDTGLSAEDREIGGLGIFMVKKSMDEMIYDYKGGKNILKVKKYY